MPDAASQEFSTQWSSPSDIFSILLILGGDVITLSIAALSGSASITPIAFSFGWAAYAMSALLSAVGDNKLMRCAPEVALRVFNLKNGHVRENASWVLGRLFRDYEFWMDADVRAASMVSQYPHDEGEQRSHTPNAVTCVLRSVFGAAPKKRDNGLCIAVYNWSLHHAPGNPKQDLVWWSGVLVTIVQLVVAAIPWILEANWAIFLVTCAGTLLSYASASLPQWKREKFATRTSKKSIALTLGQGCHHVIIVQGAENGLDLEALAAGRSPSLQSTRFYVVVLALGWIALLISSTGINLHTWFLLAVGGLGMLHNLAVAGMPRRPAALGLPIELARRPVTTGSGHNGIDTVPDIYVEEKVMFTLMELEMGYKGYGKALLSEFFPGALFPLEQEWWDSGDEVERFHLLAKLRDNWDMKKAQRVAPKE
ncbi:hypothetical protein BDU57DRAFT_514134 [Ampelomyces quisqualis]|uniref:Uncharacterized protein n=1 Tax=Ampelomyces quisqualis TaxID=50730 RepID=A0A6A5QS94_AMPQU|nr:hypothetical protein BDU57DRAFT_514134 [Ampelomyces quisqualis]